MKYPKISIVIPSFNKFKYIRKTLDSIFNQSYTNLEVIIQDGGSTDGTIEIIKKYIIKYPGEIILESQRDNGQLDAINKGFAKATGDILTFINADDLYEKDTFFTISEFYKENPESLWFVGRGVVVNESSVQIARVVTWYKNLLLKLNSKMGLLVTNYLMQPSVFITKKAYKRKGPFFGTKDFVLEYELWLKLARIQMPIVINKTLSKFRIEPGTKTMNMGKKLLFEDYKLVQKYTKNTFVLYLHLLHNKIRLFISKST